jgi:hypothetical protein
MSHVDHRKKFLAFPLSTIPGKTELVHRTTKNPTISAGFFVVEGAARNG